jgi:hypothetical protein
MNRPANGLSADAVRARAKDLIQALLDRVQSGECLDTEFTEARVGLECLPLTRDEFATATNRLASARSYVIRGERGAARFELRMLLHSL